MTDKTPMERFKGFVSDVLSVSKDDIQDMDAEIEETTCDPQEPEA